MTAPLSISGPPTGPLPQRSGSITVAELIEAYMSHYDGRDASRGYQLAWWRAQLGATTLERLDDDRVHACLQVLAQRRGRFFAGLDADGEPILRAKKEPISPASINRYAATLSALITWAVKQRIAPKGYVHPCRGIQRRPENNQRTRFLSEHEIKRLLQACKAAAWPRLFLLVLMGLTTGARRGDLLGLRWADIDMVRSEATIARTKNGDSRVMPLVPAVVLELAKFEAKPAQLVFGSLRDPSRPFCFEGQFRAALRQAQIKGVTYHTLRHSCASMLAANGATLVEIASVLGHRQLQMALRYSHLSTGHKSALVNRVLGGFA